MHSLLGCASCIVHSTAHSGRTTEPPNQTSEAREAGAARHSGALALASAGLPVRAARGMVHPCVQAGRGRLERRRGRSEEEEEKEKEGERSWLYSRSGSSRRGQTAEEPPAKTSGGQMPMPMTTVSPYAWTVVKDQNEPIAHRSSLTASSPLRSPRPAPCPSPSTLLASSSSSPAVAGASARPSQRRWRRVSGRARVRVVWGYLGAYRAHRAREAGWIREEWGWRGDRQAAGGQDMPWTGYGGVPPHIVARCGVVSSATWSMTRGLWTVTCGRRHVGCDLYLMSSYSPLAPLVSLVLTRTRL
jgi:hypothetical protein